MKKFLILIFILGSFFQSQFKTSFSAELNEVLQGVLGAVAGPKTYVFHPGEKIYSKMNERLYYSGHEYSGGKKVLLLTYVEDRNPILLKFPEPDLIWIKDLKLKILEFNNKFLKLEQTY